MHSQELHTHLFGVASSKAFLASALLLTLASSLPLPAHAAVPASERAVLDAFYTQTNGSGWSNKSGWGGVSGTECSWYGIYCDDAATHVVEIDMGWHYQRPANNLTGTLPALSGLTELKYLDVSYNALTGSVPALGGMTKLVSINLSHNQFSGTLPSLDGLVNLQNFFAHANLFTGNIPAFTSQNANLVQYAVYQNKLSGAIPSLSSLTALQSIDVGSNQLSGTIPDFTSLPNLVAFFASSNNLTGPIPAGLSNQTNLFNIDLSKNQLSGSIPDLSKLIKLGYFNVSSNNLIGDVPGLPPNPVVATICPNPLTHSRSAAWDTATGITPWYEQCPLPGQNATSTILQSSANPAVSGQSITYTATVNGHAPTGPVTFFYAMGYGSWQVLCDSVPLQGGSDSPSAPCTLSKQLSDLNGAPGYSVKAIYFEDAANSASNSNVLGQSIVKADAILAITPLSAPLTVGSPQTITVSINPKAPSQGTPTGTIFVALDGGGSCSFIPPSSSCALTPQDTHNQTLTASYSGDANFNSSNASIAPPQTQKADTQIILTANRNPSPRSGTFLQAVVSGAGLVIGIPETVVIRDGGTTLCSFSTFNSGPAGATVLCSSGSLALGSHTLVASYSGDANHNPSTSTPLPLSVYDETASISVTFSPNPAKLGEPVTATVDVRAGNPNFPAPTVPTGAVAVLDGSASCVVSLPNRTCSFTPTGTGVQSVRLSYSGDRYYDVANLTETFTVSGGSSTTTALSSDHNPSLVGYSVILTAAVIGNAPTGTVTFTDNGIALCSAVALTGTSAAATAVCETSGLSRGEHPFVAMYNGDARNASSSGTVTQHVIDSLNATTTTLSTSATSITMNQAVTLEASVIAASSPTGSIAFVDSSADGVKTLCAAAPIRIVGGLNKAFCVAVFSTPTTHVISAKYAGDESSAPSESSPLVETVISATPFNLDQYGVSGSWYNAVTSGQGFEIEVLPDYLGAGKGVFFAGWFTYDANDGVPRWYTLQGEANSPSAAVSLGIYQAVGGNFNAPPKVGASSVGAATLTFADCTHATLSYIFQDGSGRKGTIPLTRLSTPTSCTSAGDNNSASSDYFLSGAWYNATTSGQGVMFDISPSQTTLFGAWYTYALNGQSVGGSQSQRWFTLQTNSYVPGSRTASAAIYSATGGVFDDPTPITNRQVGTATIKFVSCTSLNLSFTFTSGEFAGQSGSIALTPVGPAPKGCQ